MKLWPMICIGAAFFFAIALADQLSSIHEGRKAVFIETLQADFAKKRDTRLVASFESTDWISPLSKTTTLVYAVPFGSMPVFGQDRLFGLVLASYGPSQPAEFVTADCKARTQTFPDKGGKSQIVVHEPEGPDKSPKALPGWIPDLCSDWSSELAAIRAKHHG